MNNADLFKAFGEIDEEALERSEIMGNKKIVPLRRRVVMAVAAVLVVVVLMGAAAVKYYDSIQGWFELTWEYMTGQEMTTRQAAFIERLSQDIGISQTVDGVTITVDSATAVGDVAYLLKKFEGLELTDGVMDGYMRSLNIETTSGFVTYLAPGFVTNKFIMDLIPFIPAKI